MWDGGGDAVTAFSIVLLTCFAHRDKVHYVTTGTDETLGAGGGGG